jgi:hypothetical protein
MVSDGVRQLVKADDCVPLNRELNKKLVGDAGVKDPHQQTKTETNMNEVVRLR